MNMMWWNFERAFENGRNVGKRHQVRETCGDLRRASSNVSLDYDCGYILPLVSGSSAERSIDSLLNQTINIVIESSHFIENPQALIKRLYEQGEDVRINILGLAGCPNSKGSIKWAVVTTTVKETRKRLSILHRLPRRQIWKLRSKQGAPRWRTISLSYLI